MFYITDKDYREAGTKGIKPNTLYNRVYRLGWSIERAIKEPLQAKKPSDWPAWRNKAVVSERAFYKRVNKGMTPEQAAMTLPKRKEGVIMEQAHLNAVGEITELLYFARHAE